jgi:hypothetical protein
VGVFQVPEYQYVYQPAMAFSDGAITRSIQHVRDEEGLAILSRCVFFFTLILVSLNILSL